MWDVMVLLWDMSWKGEHDGARVVGCYGPSLGHVMEGRA